MEVIKVFMKTKENRENICKTIHAWLRNFRSILSFMKKNKGYKRRERKRPGGKCLENSSAVFNSIAMNNRGPNDT